MSHKNLNTVLDLSSSGDAVTVEKPIENIGDEYNKLNEKMDKVITKIKVRRDKKK